MDVLEQNRQNRLLKSAALASVLTAGLLVVAKLVGWWLSGSISILASLVDSLLDMMASLVNMGAVYLALKPPDDNHRFGHGKAESLAGLAQSAFISGSAFFLILHAAEELVEGVPLTHTREGIGIMLFSLLMTSILLTFQHYVVRQTGSVAIAADAMHYRMDLLTILCVLVALFAASAGYPRLDPIFGIGIAVYMMFGVRKVFMQSIDLLMDKELPEEQDRKIEEVALKTPGVKGIHDIKTRMSGRFPVIQLHIELEGSQSLFAAHEIADNVERDLLHHFKGADIIIHQDPV
jgi:ferrous-iron efflux pump FieF